MKKNRTAGFTLVEMLIAMGISMIVIAGVSQFLLVSTNTFNAVDTQVNVQMDALDAMNTISDMVMEGNNVAKRQMDDGTDFYTVYYNLGQTDSNGDLYNYATANQRIFWLNQTDNNLYLIHTKDNTQFRAAMASKDGKQLLAEGVNNFAISVKNVSGSSITGLTPDGVSAGEDRTLLQVSISFQSEKRARGKDGMNYDSSQDVMIRNKVIAIPQ